MVGHKTAGMSSTDPWTWVHAVLVYTGEGGGTLLVANTLWLTFNIWVPNVIPDTFTRCCLVSLCTLGVYATRRGVARLDYLDWSRSGCGGVTVRKGITNIVSIAGTDRNMVSDLTISINTTNTRAGINTLLVLAGLF